MHDTTIDRGTKGRRDEGTEASAGQSLIVHSRESLTAVVHAESPNERLQKAHVRAGTFERARREPGKARRRRPAEISNAAKLLLVAMIAAARFDDDAVPVVYLPLTDLFEQWGLGLSAGYDARNQLLERGLARLVYGGVNTAGVYELVRPSAIDTYRETDRQTPDLFTPTGQNAPAPVRSPARSLSGRPESEAGLPSGRADPVRSSARAGPESDRPSPQLLSGLPESNHANLSSLSGLPESEPGLLSSRPDPVRSSARAGPESDDTYYVTSYERNVTCSAAPGKNERGEIGQGEAPGESAPIADEMPASLEAMLASIVIEGQRFDRGMIVAMLASPHCTADNIRRSLAAIGPALAKIRAKGQKANARRYLFRLIERGCRPRIDEKAQAEQRQLEALPAHEAEDLIARRQRIAAAAAENGRVRRQLADLGAADLRRRIERQIEIERAAGQDFYATWWTRRLDARPDSLPEFCLRALWRQEPIIAKEGTQ